MRDVRGAAKKAVQAVGRYFRLTDKLLLLFCMMASALGIVLITAIAQSDTYANVGTVSYTHLDNVGDIGGQLDDQGFGAHLPNLPDHLGGAVAGPVSYTHLDVYKRQSYNSAALSRYTPKKLKL